MILTLVIITGVGIYAGSKVKTAADFTGSSRKAGPTIIAGTIMGTLVGGASTVGTAQLAFEYGFCAWWFTLGAGIGCLILAIVMLKPLYTSDQETIPQYLVQTYGQAIGPVASIFTSLGMFFNLMGQGIAAVALLTAVFGLNTNYAVIISIILVLGYVLSGGVQGTGMVGVVKLVLLYTTTIVAGTMAFQMFGGLNGIRGAFPEHFPWFSLLGRGVSTDLAAGFSLLVGVLSTQTYIQAILSGRNLRVSRQGALLSAFLIPPIGIGGILVGLFMRAHAASFPGLESGAVLPVFIMHYLPPIAAGITIAVLLVTVIGTWAGISLGISTLLTRDIYQRFVNPKADSSRALLVQRAFIIALAVLAYYCVTGTAGSLILGFSFLSMGLRGCTVLFPLLGAIFFPGLVTPAGGLAAALIGPITDCAWKFIYPHGIDPLYPGLLASLLSLIIASLVTRKRRSHKYRDWSDEIEFRQ
jgi:SSS family solute:Na+ symporter